MSQDFHLNFLESALDDIETHFDQFLSSDSMNLMNLSDLCTDELQQAQLHSFIAYTLNSLYFMYLRVNGTDIKVHPIQNELKRIQNYLLKVQNISKKVKK